MERFVEINCRLVGMKMSMERLTYENFIAALNNGSILEISFEIIGYAHYKKCKIYRKDDVLSNGKIISLIKVKLVDDGSEEVSFYNVFNENYKLFYMGRKGSFTLKQMWNKIQIHEIITKHHGNTC